MEEEARKRKERLAAIRQGKGINEIEEYLKNTETSPAQVDTDIRSPPSPSHLSSSPHLSSSSPSQADPLEVTVERQVKYLLEEAKGLVAGRAATQDEDITLEALAPKKPNWDLKRDLERRYESLDRQTNKAIIKLIKDRQGQAAVLPDQNQ